MLLFMISVDFAGDIMTSFNNFAALERQIMKDITSAANRAKDRIEMELLLNVNNYYDGSSPQIYQRTGTLLTSPDSTSVQVNGKSLEFSVYMNDRISYSTGTFSGAQVIEATEKGTAGTIGNHGYFQRTEDKVESILNSEFANL